MNDKPTIKSSSHTTLEWEKVDSILTNETKRNKHESWSKINKTSKIKLLTDYANVIAEDKELSTNEAKGLEQYLIVLLEKKKLNSVKDVTYDKIKGKITNIPSLVYSDITRKFVLQRNDKRQSTLKSLGKGKNRTRKKIEVDKDINISS